MVKKVSTVQLRKELSALLARVVKGGGQVIIEKRGKPLAALVSVDALELLEQQQTTSANPQGALALTGAWGELKDRDMDAAACRCPGRTRWRRLPRGGERLMYLLDTDILAQPDGPLSFDGVDCETGLGASRAAMHFQHHA